MEEGIPEIPCSYCQAYNRVDRVFCLACRGRLTPLTQFDISQDDYTYPPDRDGIDAIQQTEPLPHLIDKLVTRNREKSLRSWLSANAQCVQPGSRLDTLIRSCGVTLGLEVLPETFIAPSRQVNASTTGTEKDPILIISAAALRVLNEQEMSALLGHELAHVKSKHMLYHTLAESLATGAGIVAPFLGVGMISLPIRMLLLGWYRESEVSADRASLLIVSEPRIFESLMTKIIGYNGDISVGGGGTAQSIAELFQTHPALANRVQRVREFHRSPEFRRAQQKIKLRKDVSKALVPFCRFCKASKPVTEIYCGVCGRSQA